jgi:hypothetical protein
MPTTVALPVSSRNFGLRKSALKMLRTAEKPERPVGATKAYAVQWPNEAVGVAGEDHLLNLG